MYQGPSPVLLPLTHANGKVFKIHYLNEKEVSGNHYSFPERAN